MTRQLRTRYTVESQLDLRTASSYLLQRGFEFEYIRPVRWWQVWRWCKLWSPDYHLSRADEQILVQQMAGIIKKDIEEETSALVAERQTR